MIFIFGGKYQGKKEYAIKTLGYAEDSILEVGDLIPIEADLDQWIESLREKVVIMDDVSQGIVPMEREAREKREALGRLMVRLAHEAEEVHRVFCGIGSRIK